MDEMKEKNIPIEELDSPFSEHVLKLEIIPKNNEKYNEGLNDNEFNMMKKYCKNKNYIEPPKKTFKTIQNISYIDNKDNYEIFNVLLLGNTYVGKTCICFSMITKKFCEYYFRNIGIESFFFYRDNDETFSKKRFIIYDSSGDERFKLMSLNYYKKADVILLVYAVIDYNSFNDLNKWLLLINDNCSQDIIKILIANKCDMEDKRVITERQGREFADIHGFKYIETSAKENINIQEIFELLKDTKKNRLLSISKYKK